MARGLRHIILACIGFHVLFSACAPRIGNDGFRVVAKGTAYLEGDKTRQEASEEAKTQARQDIGTYLQNYPEIRSKYAGLLGRAIDDLLVVQSASRAPIIYEDWGREAGADVAYSWAAIPLVAPNAYVTGGLSILFPGLGQIYAKTGGYGHVFLGMVGAGAAFYTYLQYDEWNNKYLRETKLDLIQDYYDTSNNWYKYTQASLAAYGVITVFSSIQAFTLARSSQELLRILRQEGGISTSSNHRLMMIPNYGTRSLSFYYKF